MSIKDHLPTEIMTEGQLDSFCGEGGIDGLDQNKSYNLSGIHLWQILDGYRHLIATKTEQPVQVAHDEQWLVYMEKCARLDDWHMSIVGSDIRQLISLIRAYQAAPVRESGDACWFVELRSHDGQFYG